MMYGKGSSIFMVMVVNVICALVQVLEVDEDSMEHLLHCCLWSTDSLIQHYLDHPESLCKEVGLRGDPAIPPPAKGDKLSCPICLLNVPTTDMLWLWCNHACCKVTQVSRIIVGY